MRGGAVTYAPAYAAGGAASRAAHSVFSVGAYWLPGPEAVAVGGGGVSSMSSKFTGAEAAMAGAGILGADAAVVPRASLIPSKEKVVDCSTGSSIQERTFMGAAPALASAGAPARGVV